MTIDISGTFNGDEEANLKNQIQKSNLKSELENLRISKQKIGKKFYFSQKHMKNHPITFWGFKMHFVYAL